VQSSGRLRTRVCVRWVPLLIACVVLSACTLKAVKQPARITYNLPTKLTVKVGERLPGTDIQYESLAEKGAYLRINGQSALKRRGDSVAWQGEPLPGVSVDLSLRVAWYTEEQLYLVGMAKIVVNQIQPHEMPAMASAPIKYTGPVVYSVGKGVSIPGSTITFQERTEEGAKLGGISGYAYRKGGDSILWEGSLRDRVYVRLDLRVLQFDDQVLRVGGIVTVWINS
jgi:hypothetical protein